MIICLLLLINAPLFYFQFSSGVTEGLKKHLKGEHEQIAKEVDTLIKRKRETKANEKEAHIAKRQKVKEA